MNCESLGNSCSHVHWHSAPRYGTVPYPDKAIWNIERKVIDSVTLNDTELSEMNGLLLAEFKRLIEKYHIEGC